MMKTLLMVVIFTESLSNVKTLMKVISIAYRVLTLTASLHGGSLER